MPGIAGLARDAVRRGICIARSKQSCSSLWHHPDTFFAGVMMEWWVIAVELGVPAIIGLAIYLTLRK